MWVVNVTSLVLEKAWGRNCSLLLGQLILTYIPVHLFKEAEIYIPLISL